MSQTATKKAKTTPPVAAKAKKQKLAAMPDKVKRAQGVELKHRRRRVRRVGFRSRNHKKLLHAVNREQMRGELVFQVEPSERMLRRAIDDVMAGPLGRVFQGKLAGSQVGLQKKGAGNAVLTFQVLCERRIAYLCTVAAAVLRQSGQKTATAGLIKSAAWIANLAR